MFFGQAERNLCKQLASLLAPRCHPLRVQSVGSWSCVCYKSNLYPTVNWNTLLCPLRHHERVVTLFKPRL